jgi:hypothetical protein
MNDDVRAQLVEALAKQNFAGMTPGLQADLLQIYSDTQRALCHTAETQGMGEVAGRVATVEEHLG